MDVKPIPGNPGFRVNASTEASEQRRNHHGRDQGPKPGEKADESPSDTSPPASNEMATSTNDADVPPGGQMIDSEKVVELLAHRPPPQNRPEAFKKLAVLKSSEKPSFTGITDGKKLGKSF